MSLNMEGHLNGISLKMECHSKGNFIKNGMSLKIKYHSDWNGT